MKYWKQIGRILILGLCLAGNFNVFSQTNFKNILAGADRTVSRLTWIKSGMIGFGSYRLKGGDSLNVIRYEPMVFGQVSMGLEFHFPTTIIKNGEKEKVSSFSSISAQFYFDGMSFESFFTFLGGTRIEFLKVSSEGYICLAFNSDVVPIPYEGYANSVWQEKRIGFSYTQKYMCLPPLFIGFKYGRNLSFFQFGIRLREIK